MLKIATWNMNHWRRSVEQRAQTWAYLEAEVKPDIAMLQEAAPGGSPSDRVWHGGVDSKDWGSPVASYGPALEPLTHVKSLYGDRGEMDLLRAYSGAVSIAQLTTAGGTLVTLVSAYGKWEGGYSNTVVHRILSDLQPLIDKHHAQPVLPARR